MLHLVHGTPSHSTKPLIRAVINCATNQVETYMAHENVTEELGEKSKELKQMLKDLKATIETWKFSVEESKDGLRIEIHAVALLKNKGK